jgi:predicted small secreted protein
MGRRAVNAGGVISHLARKRRARPLAAAALLAACAVLAACSTTTNGSGSGNATGATGSSTPDFPSTSASGGSSSSPSGPGSTSSANPHPVPSTPVRTVTVVGSHNTYVVKIWAEVTDPTCFDHAYGTSVITYLTQHPCGGLTRRLATTTVNGRGVGFAQSTLNFKGTAPKVYTTAGDFEQLVTKDGTGNIDDLLRDGYRLPSGPTRVPSPDAFKALGQDGGCTITDAWYLSGSTPNNDPALVTMAQDFFLQF